MGIQHVILIQMDSAVEEYLVPINIPVSVLDIVAAFEKLTEPEKKYAHFISRASWAGSRAVLEQVSEESPLIFAFIQKLFSWPTSKVQELALSSGVSKESFGYFLDYVVQFYGNMGNYLSFGDQKFLPRISQDDMKKFVSSFSDSELSALWDKCSEKVYSLLPHEHELGLEGKGVSTYYSKNITKADIDFVQEYLNQNQISAYNTRLWKDESGNYELRFAAANSRSEEVSFKGKTIKLVADFSPFMKDVADNLQLAVPHAANEHQAAMLKSYVQSFLTGDINQHKDAQRHWIKDKGPVVETNIGFIESYRDPAGIRGEWEGWTAIVDKAQSEKFGKLVSSATTFIALLPWPKCFEKDTYLKPDFTSLEVLNYAASGIPAGINIPNYDDIRQNEGFKNVSLGNVLRSRTSSEKVSFIHDEDQKLFEEHLDIAFEVQVGIHELLGHGSGKLLEIDEQGKTNFDPVTTIDPLTSAPVKTWYKTGETWGSKFGGVAQTIEECRAEACGLYLCSEDLILEIFGISQEKKKDVVYINWLSMVRKGILALETYSPETRKWRQAHMQARFAILNVLREAGESLVEITKGDDPLVSIDKSKIETIGRKAIGDFLCKLMVYKATANVADMTTLYDKYCDVTDEYLALRKFVMEKKKPRQVFVQARTEIVDDHVKIQHFEPTREGLIESMRNRFTF